MSFIQPIIHSGVLYLLFLGSPLKILGDQTTYITAFVGDTILVACDVNKCGEVKRTWYQVIYYFF